MEGGTIGSPGPNLASHAVSSLLGQCPKIAVRVGVVVNYLLDTGSMVSTIVESFFVQHFQDNLQHCHWLQLRAANGLEIPYTGYVELTVEVLGKVIPQRRWLVVKDPPGQSSLLAVPGVLGMNGIRECYNELFGQHGPALFDLRPVVHTSPPWQQALQHCHQAQLRSPKARTGVAKVRDRKPVYTPGGTVKLVAATCSPQFGVASTMSCWNQLATLYLMVSWFHQPWCRWTEVQSLFLLLMWVGLV